MRIEDRARKRQRGLLAPRRLVRQHVERGASEVAGLERGPEGFVVDEVTARAVDEEGAGLHASDRGRVQDAPRRAVERSVERHDVSAGEQIAEHDRLDALGPDVLVGHERVADDHVHTERARPPRDGAADAPEADHAEAGTGDPPRTAVEDVPASGPDVAIELGHAAQQTDHHGDGVLGHLLGAVAGDVRAPDAGIRERLHVEVVEARCVGRHRLEPRQPRQLRPADRHIRRDEQADDVVSLGTLGRLDRDVRVPELFLRPRELPGRVDDEDASAAHERQRTVLAIAVAERARPLHRTEVFSLATTRPHGRGLREELAVVEGPVARLAGGAVGEPEPPLVERHDRRHDGCPLIVGSMTRIGVAADGGRVAGVVGERPLEGVHREQPVPRPRAATAGARGETGCPGSPRATRPCRGSAR